MTVLKEQITKHETQKQADKECLKAMQEMVESLTEYKLTSTNKIADSERKENLLNAKIIEYENQLRSFSELSIEHEALQRQVKRLTEENEEQAIDLNHMHEKLQHVTQISEIQNSQLIELEKSVDHWKEIETKYNQLASEYEALQKSCNEIQTESQQTVDTGITRLEDEKKTLKDSLNQITSDLEKTKAELDRVVNEFSALKEQSETAESNIDRYVKENEGLREQISNQTNRLSKYKTKLIEFSTKLKQLRHTKEVLLDTVTDYSESITKWQSEIVIGSKQLFDKLDELEKKNISLEEQLKRNESTIQSEVIEKNDRLYALNEIEIRYQDLLKQQEESTVKINDQNELIETLKSNSIEMEKMEHLSLENKKLHDSLEILVAENNQLKERINNLNVDLENSNKNNDAFSECLENERVAHQKRVEVLDAEIADLKANVNANVLEINGAHEKISLQNKQNDDLLMEMRELNEALKNRGDVISKQNAELSNLQQLVQDNAGRINELDNNLKEKDKSIEQLTNSLAKYGKSDQETNGK